MVGRADTVPIDSNETPEGRARNRRVDVVILNRLQVQHADEPESRGPPVNHSCVALSNSRRVPSSMKKIAKNSEKAPGIIDKTTAR